jgi:hypothetical protein
MRRSPAFLLATLAGLLLAPAAQAHDAQRVKLVTAVDINAPPAAVWRVIGQFHDLSWDPLVASAEGPGGDTPNVATRTVKLKSGGVLPLEQLTRYEPQSFTYATFLPHVDVKVLPVTNYSSILVVLPEPGGSRVEWRSAFYRGDPNFGPPPNLNEAAAIKAVRAMTQPALDGLKQRIEQGHAQG